MPQPVKFKANCPRNVNRDAKYSVRRDGKKDVITLIYNTKDGERWYATTNEHPRLINMIANVRREFNQQPYGTFYINEYKQVILPIIRESEYYYAGEYDQPLIFDFEGKQISGRPVDFYGNPLQTGDEWIGAHQGIPFILVAGGNDIRYERTLRPNVIQKVHLSSFIGKQKTKAIIEKIIPFVGFQGGRFYVNEFGAIFRPLYDEDNLKYIYITQINFDYWFPKPEPKEINGEIIIV